MKSTNSVRTRSKFYFAPGACLLSARDLKRHYPVPSSDHWFKPDLVRAVDGVNLCIYPGETLGLVGESGSGKSTLGRLLVGLEEPDEGEICYKGIKTQDFTAEERTEARLDRQMIFQDPYSSFNPKKRIYDILVEPLLFHHLIDPHDGPKVVSRLLQLVELPPDSMYRYPQEFSGGQLQRVGVAAALSMEPNLIVCDEPVSALDVSIQAQILNLLKSLQQDLGVTYLFIAHGLAAVKYISDRIAVLYLGRLVEVATASELFRHPLHPYTQALIAASPLPEISQPDPEKLLKGELPSNIHPPTGCTFHPRCPLAREACRHVDMELLDFAPEQEEEHWCACPYMVADMDAARQAGEEVPLAFPGAAVTADFTDWPTGDGKRSHE